MNEFKIYIFGARGSIPVSGPLHREYGGGTSSCLIQAGTEWILWDAGNGLLQAPSVWETPPSRLTMVLSHPHLDHISGLLLFPPMVAGIPISIFGAPRDGLSVRDQVGAMMRPPLWPVGLEVFSKQVRFFDLPADPIFVGGVRIDHMEGCHPGGSTVYRVSFEGRSAVFAVDYEHGTAADDRLLAFAADCGVLLYDGHYSREDYASHTGWGHSTPDMGVQLARQCGARRLVIFHHGPNRTDAVLAADEMRLQKDFPALVFAREGMELNL